MTSNQRLIKMIAIGLAIFIILAMINGLIFLFDIVTSNIGDDNVTYKVYDIKDVSNIDIDISASNLVIKNSEVFKIEITDRTNYSVENNTLYIKDKSKWFKKHLDNMVVYIPYEKEFNDIKIHGGAGSITIDDLNTKSLLLELGDGKATIDNIEITNKLTVHGGAGDFKISNGDLNKVDIDMGVGNFNIAAMILNGGNIDVGVGNLDVDLLDDIENYSFEITKGIGNIKVDGNNVTKGTIGTGSSLIKINGGVGNIKVY